MKLNILVSQVVSIYLLATTGFANGRNEEDSLLRGRHSSSSKNREEVVSGGAAQRADRVDTLLSSKVEHGQLKIGRPKDNRVPRFCSDCSLDVFLAMNIKVVYDYLKRNDNDDFAEDLKSYYCCSTSENKKLFNIVFGKALDQGGSFLNCFLKSVLPSLITWSVSANLRSTTSCSRSEEVLLPIVKTRSSSDPDGEIFQLSGWGIPICADPDICSYSQVNGFLKDIIKNVFEDELSGYDVIEHFSPNKKCRDATKMSFRPGPTSSTDFCTYLEVCGEYRYVDVQLPPPIGAFTIAVCAEGCSGWLPENEYLKLLQATAGSSRALTKRNPYESYYCLSESTAHEVSLEFNNDTKTSTHIDYFEECENGKDLKRKGLCCSNVGSQRCIEGDETKYFECAYNNGYPGMSLITKSLPAGTKCCAAPTCEEDRISITNADFDCPR